MIRAIERSPEHAGHSSLATCNHRIPIFAVSASLVEKEKATYVESGFDGWILKPIDFKRLNTLLAGISDEQVRASCLYEAGEWERGGWFCNRSDVGLLSSEVTPKAEETSERRMVLDEATAKVEETPDKGPNHNEVTPKAEKTSDKGLAINEVTPNADEINDKRLALNETTGDTVSDTQVNLSDEFTHA